MIGLTYEKATFHVQPRNPIQSKYLTITSPFPRSGHDSVSNRPELTTNVNRIKYPQTASKLHQPENRRPGRITRHPPRVGRLALSAVPQTRPRKPMRLPCTGKLTRLSAAKPGSSVSCYGKRDRVILGQRRLLFRRLIYRDRKGGRDLASVAWRFRGGDAIKRPRLAASPPGERGVIN